MSSIVDLQNNQKGSDKAIKISNLEKVSSIEIKIAGCSEDDNVDVSQQQQQQQQLQINQLGGDNLNNKEAKDLNPTIHAYKKRFFILVLFCAHSAINSFQWIQYSSITNVIADYYGASNLYVNLTSLVYMITYIPFIIHASLMLERVGLRKAVVLGTLGTALGSFIKWVLGGQPGIVAFYWMMLGQTIVALSQLYIISIPPLLAAVWFPDNQVSTATGIGVFGNQFGIALGFIIPPMIITSNFNNVTNQEEKLKIYGTELNFLARSVFWLSFSICIVSILYFQDKPPKPPGSASLHAQQQQQQQYHENQQQSYTNIITKQNTIVKQDAQQQEAEMKLISASEGGGSNNNSNNKEVCKFQEEQCSQVKKDNNNQDAFATIKELYKDKDFRYLVLSYGINVGCFYAISTVLNQMVSSTWSEQVDLAGKMGLLIVISGMAGSIICGQLLDRYHAYKLIIVLIYLFSLISMLLFAIILKVLTTTTWPLYLTSIILGFFMTGYLPLGFEFAAEITYPHPANTPAGLLNLSAQVFGLALTYISSIMVDGLGNMWANSFLTACLVIGLILTLLMKADLKRQKAVAEEQMKI